jgi:zinc transport system ATP-binding protein
VTSSPASLASTASTASQRTPVIELEHASFGYADVPVVREVTLSVAPGEVVALLGANGSGKSTLVKGLLGLSDQQGGTVRLFGVPREDFDDHPRLGYVPQRHTLSASVRATVEEIVAVGRLPHRQWWRPRLSSAEDARIIRECLEVVGLADRAQADVSTLSGGQQRRVLIARALAARPDVLVMDEPTAGVDTANQEILAQVLSRLADRGTTMLIVTHELEVLAGIVTRIVALSGGRVTFDGSPAAFAAAPPGGSLAFHGHHHADELEDVGDGRLPGARVSGPLDSGREVRHG